MRQGVEEILIRLTKFVLLMLILWMLGVGGGRKSGGRIQSKRVKVTIRNSRIEEF